MRYREIFAGLIVLFFSSMPFLCCAQDTTIVCNKYATVKEEKNIVALANKYDDYNRNKEFTDGYRIQIMYTDIRSEAYKIKGQMYKDFADLNSYVEYEEPYFKLRIGDFKTRLEATYYMQQVTPLYNGAFIVKDKIRIKQ